MVLVLVASHRHELGDRRRDLAERARLGGVERGAVGGDSQVLECRRQRHDPEVALVPRRGLGRCRRGHGHEALVDAEGDAPEDGAGPEQEAAARRPEGPGVVVVVLAPEVVLGPLGERLVQHRQCRPVRVLEVACVLSQLCLADRQRFVVRAHCTAPSLFGRASWVG